MALLSGKRRRRLLAAVLAACALALLVPPFEQGGATLYRPVFAPPERIIGEAYVENAASPDPDYRLQITPAGTIRWGLLTFELVAVAAAGGALFFAFDPDSSS